MDPIVCTYVVEEPIFSEAAGFKLAAAMGSKWLETNAEDPLLAEWLDSGYRKHLRRAKASVFKRLIEEIPGTVVTDDRGARLWASPLTRATKIPNLVKRLQMSNFSFRTVEPLTSLMLQDDSVQIVVDRNLDMSFGKAGIAVAHASQNLTLALRELDPTSLDIWRSRGYPVLPFRGEFLKGDEPTAIVEDHGLTEVEAGAITAKAFFVHRRHTIEKD